MLAPVILYNAVTLVIAAFQWFAEPFVMTDGGPNNATLFYSLYLYQNAFQFFKMGYAVGPNVDVELIEPDKNPNSTWRHDLDANGEGFHHIAFVVKGMKDKIAACEKQDFKLLQTGEYAGGRYAYVDANNALKLVLELLEND
jgi:hypothetical protein